MKKGSRKEKTRTAASNVTSPTSAATQRSRDGGDTVEEEEEEGEEMQNNSVTIDEGNNDHQEEEEDEEEEVGIQEDEGEEEYDEEEFESDANKLNAEEGEDSDKNSNQCRMDKPQIWVRIKASTMDSMYDIGEDHKTLKLMIKPEDRLFQKKSGDTVCFSFETEGILLGPRVAQEDLYEATARQLVDNALQGVSGVVVCVGPEQSGKSFSLFGPDGYFQDRGIVQRTLEDIFARLQNNPKGGEFHIILSMFEVRKDRVKDLITLSPEELTRVGNFGPKGLFFEEVLSIDHALGLVLRGLAGQRIMPCEVHPPHAKYHTLVYIDVLAHVKQESWRSRITFAKIASVPPKMNNLPNSAKQTRSNFSLCRTTAFSGRKDNCFSTDGIPRRCCGGPHGQAAELINVRKDMYFLEQMLTKCYDVRKITEYYSELEKLGMYMLMGPPNTNPSQYFRQSKLSHCLKDIVSGSALVRLILHVRPERDFLHSTLEIMRFAERVRYMPCGSMGSQNDESSAAGDDSEQHKTCEEAGVNTNPIDHHAQDKIHQNKLKDAFKTATTLFEEKLEAFEETTKEQVRPVFDGFKEMWEGMLDKEFTHEIPEQAVGDGNEEGGEDVIEIVPIIDLDGQQPLEINNNIPMDKAEKEEEPPSIKPEKMDNNKNKQVKRRQSTSKGAASRRASRKIRTEVDDSGDATSKKRKKASQAHLLRPSNQNTEEDDESTTDATVVSLASIADINNSSSNSGPNTEMSITVIPAGTAETLDGNDSLIANLHFKCKCWEEFEKSYKGTPIVVELGEKQQLLKQYMADHNETLNEVVHHLSKLVAIELNLNELEPNRRFSDENDKMNLLTTKEQRRETAAQAKKDLKKLQEQQANIRSLSNILQSTKQECDRAFDQFCEGSNGSGMMDSNHRPPVDGELELRYDEINRIAKHEAQILIRKAYPSRPPWTMFY